MENMFNDLKEKMNETVLRDIDFSEKSKEKVRRAVKESKSKRKLTFRPKLHYVVSVALSGCLLFGIGYYTFNQLGGTNDPQYSSSLVEAPFNREKTDKEDVTNAKKSIYIPPPREEFFGEMTKEDVVNKMLNTPHQFETVDGQFEVRNEYQDGTGSVLNVDYELSTINEIGGVVSFINHSLEGEHVQDELTVFNEEQVWYMDYFRKEYRQHEINPQPLRNTVTSEEALAIDPRKIYDDLQELYDWEPLPVGVAAMSIYPFEMAVDYLGQYEQWEIEKQNEEVLSHNTVVIHGKVSDHAKRFKNIDTFRTWIDKDTGFLVRHEEYDESGNVTSYINTTKLEVNVPLDSISFTPDLEGLTKMDIPGGIVYADPREEEIEVVDHADYYKEDVKQVLEKLKKDVSFLLEIEHPDVEIYSASYERYESYNQGYLTYSYKKAKDVDGSGSKLLYVRSYHRDAVVRSWGEFDTNKGEQIDEFTAGDINWTVYELDMPNSNHFVGTSGEYKYEIVTQDIPFEEAKAILE
ncbi:hypothetical protein GCM10008967_37420 [Bacillus carboniphilus]|uniref:DUF4367 domain-containing protein n=1 Tax=Bacillus carboniphilus TaxID=86663 RepID=A0ABP3GG07_9BACI